VYAAQPELAETKREAVPKWREDCSRYARGEEVPLEDHLLHFVVRTPPCAALHLGRMRRPIGSGCLRLRMGSKGERGGGKGSRYHKELVVENLMHETLSSAAAGECGGQ
jgi:hypothetical protein